jgi:hypothetical protein
MMTLYATLQGLGVLLRAAPLGLDAKCTRKYCTDFPRTFNKKKPQTIDEQLPEAI